MTDNKAVDLLKRLVACQSITPNDAGCQEIIRQELAGLGFVFEDFSAQGVTNMWASHGSGLPHFVYSGHTDVVPVGDVSKWHNSPFTATISDGYIYGRGVADMKGSLAAMSIAIKEYIQQNPKHPGTISLLITSDEEGPSQFGTKYVMEQLQQRNTEITWCIVGEPSAKVTVGDTIRHGRRGSLTGNIVFYGKQGHIAYPAKAQNPIHAALPVLAKLSAIEWDQANADFPASSLQIIDIASGVGASNVIPATLSAQFNIRFGTSIDEQHIKQVTATTLAQQGLPFEIDWKENAQPFLSRKGKLLDVVQSTIAAITGNAPELCTAGGTSDARFIVKSGCEIVELGLCNDSIHAVNERTSVKDIEQLTTVYNNILSKLFL